MNKKNIEHDIRGQICPANLLIALKSMNTHREELRLGQVRLLFRTDSRDATLTIPDAAANMGYAVSVTKEPDGYVISVESTE